MSEQKFVSDDRQDEEPSEQRHLPELLFGKKQNYKPIHAFNGYCASYIARADDESVVFAKTFTNCNEKYRDAIYRNELSLIPTLSNAKITARLLDTGLKDPLIIQPYIEGKNLEDHICESELPSPKEAREIATPIFKKAQAMHDLGVTHRDLKPANIVIPFKNRKPSYAEQLIIDFGFAKVKGQKDRLNDVFGTPLYQAPEQMTGDETDRRCDIYAAGIILYEIMTGKLPYDENIGRLDLCKLKRWAPIREKFEDYRLSEAITKATQPDPSRRFQSFNEFADAIQPRTFWSWISSKVKL